MKTGKNSKRADTRVVKPLSKTDRTDGPIQSSKSSAVPKKKGGESEDSDTSMISVQTTKNKRKSKVKPEWTVTPTGSEISRAISRNKNAK